MFWNRKKYLIMCSLGTVQTVSTLTEAMDWLCYCGPEAYIYEVKRGKRTLVASRIQGTLDDARRDRIPTISKRLGGMSCIQN